MKHTIWQCDRCLREMQQVEAPCGWMVASVRAINISDLGMDTTKEWCGQCWRDIRETLPQIATVQP